MEINVINPYKGKEYEIPARRFFRKASFEKIPDVGIRPISFLMDVSPYFKGFISDKNNKAFSELSGGACKMYLWIQNHSSIKNEYIFIYKKEYEFVNGNGVEGKKKLSEKTFKSHITELIAK